MDLVFFISHSHKDERIASALVSFLKLGVGVETKEIRCTSQLSTGLESGADINQQLLKDIKRCQYFMPLITENSLSSEFVGFEIGAAWALQKENIRPLVYSKSDDIQIPALIKGYVYRNISKLEHLVQLGHDLTTDIFYKSDRATTLEILDAAKAFLSQVGT